MPCKGPLLAPSWSAVECWSLTEPLPKPLSCLVPLMHTCSAFIPPQISQLFSSHAELYVLSLTTAAYNAERACRSHRSKKRRLAVHRDRRAAWYCQAADPGDGCAEVGKAGSVTGFTLRVFSTDVARSAPYGIHLMDLGPPHTQLHRVCEHAGNEQALCGRLTPNPVRWSRPWRLGVRKGAQDATRCDRHRAGAA